MNKYEIDYNNRIGALLKKKQECEENYKNSSNDLNFIKEQIKYIDKTIQFMRVGNDTYENEKSQIYDKFPDEFYKRINKDSLICFHGCKNIWAVGEIIKSCEISSGYYRLGFATSFDNENEISATNVKDSVVAIRYYSGLKNPTTLPAGALFAIKPKNKNEVITSSSFKLIRRIDLFNNPERLVAIITTKENIDLVKSWLKDSIFDEDIAYTFEEILNNIDVLNLSEEEIYNTQKSAKKKIKTI